MKVLICGGGVIGTAIAHFLSRRGVAATVVERTGVANAASGKSGGFLALDWCDGSPLAPLARRSFDLHVELAGSLGRDWGYRRVDTLGVVTSTRQDVSRYRAVQSPSWLGADSAVYRKIGTPQTTAQIHPALFTKAMMAEAAANGATLVEGCVDGLTFAADGNRVTGAIVDGVEIAADAVVIAMGPWSILACQWLPLPAVYGSKGHSLVFRYEPTPESLFVELEWRDGETRTPEINPRPDGTTYVCGLPGDDPLPVDPARVLPEPGACETLRRMTASIAPELGAAEILAEQACYRPVTQDGLPFIGPVPGIRGAFIATGHNVWGMLNAPATGEAMAQLLCGDETTVDLRPFNPARLAAQDPNAIFGR
jgi:glycine/D-amino acid oxidase-like deaminating enzyme